MSTSFHSHVKNCERDSEMDDRDEMETQIPKDHAEAEHALLARLQEARQDTDRYVSSLQYGNLLMKTGRWEEARNFLIQSAQIALQAKNDHWLALAHEALGDLSAHEANWFGTLHHYRYARRKSALQRLEAKIRSAQHDLHTRVLSQDSRIVALRKEYVSGNLAISFVHRDIFLKSYFARCLECTFCHDWCCSFGADIDVQNVERINQRRNEILPFVRPPEGEWFDPEFTYYEEYAGNQYTRIQVQGPRCIFISNDQRGCGLHRYALHRGIDYHEIKPLVCILFPLSFEEGVLSVAAELEDHSLVCEGAGESVYQSLRNELEYYLGREFVEEVDEIEQKVLPGS